MAKRLASLFVGLILLFLYASNINAYYNYMPASVVVGQTNFSENSTSLTQNKFGSSIRSVFVDPNGRLLISDTGNSRVLIWNKVPTTNGTNADLVLGQDNFTSGSANRGGTLNSNTLNGPAAMWSDGTKLLIADDLNHRVLYWRNFPTTNGQAADVVIGQTDFITATTNTCNALNPRFPNGVVVYNGKLLVSSRSAPGNRIMIWNSIPETNGVNADNVIGQPNLTTCNAASTSSTGLNSPRELDVSDDGKLFVADNSNVRILIYNSIPTTDGAAADVVVGQSGFSTATSQTTQNGLSNPFGVSVVNNRLYIGDQTNNRILIYNNIPTSNGASANIVLGSTNFTTIYTGLSDREFRLHHIFATKDQIFAIDPVNARVLIFNNVESPPKVSIDSVISVPGSKLKILGSVVQGERGKYAIQNIQAAVNGGNFDDIVDKDSGQDFGVDSTIYKFSYEFLPWANNGTSGTWEANGYTLRLKTNNYNAESDNLFYFSPFNLISASGKVFQFKAPKSHWQKLKDNLDSFEVQIQKSGSNTWTKLEDGIKLKDSMFNASSGVITINTLKEVPAGSYNVKIVAKDNWGHYQNSNTLSLKQKSRVSSTISSDQESLDQKAASPSLDPEEASTSESKSLKEAKSFISNIKDFLNSILKAIFSRFGYN